MRDSHNLTRTVRKALLSLLIGACVFGTAYVAAWLGFRDLPQFSSHRMRTQISLRELHDAIEQYRTDTAVLPVTMGNLAVVEEQGLETDENGRVLDPWGHPFAYSQTDGGFEIWSFGRDGRAGGVGLDADLCADGRGSYDSLPTLRQFALEPNTGRIFGACLASGLLAAAMYQVLSRWHKHKEDRGKVVGHMLLTFVFSLFVAAVLAVLNASGH